MCDSPVAHSSGSRGPWLIQSAHCSSMCRIHLHNVMKWGYYSQSSPILPSAPRSQTRLDVFAPGPSLVPPRLAPAFSGGARRCPHLLTPTSSPPLTLSRDSPASIQSNKTLLTIGKWGTEVIQRFSNQRPLKALFNMPNIHSFMHTLTHRRRCQP